MAKEVFTLSEYEKIQELKAPILFEMVGNEKALEENIVANIEDLCEGLNLPPILTVATQRMIKCENFYIKPDILVRHKDETMTVFEVKKANGKYPSTGPTNQMTAIGQLLLYQTVLQEKINAPVRLALIDNKIYYRTYCAFINFKLPITLIDFQKDRVFVPYNGWE